MARALALLLVPAGIAAVLVIGTAFGRGQAETGAPRRGRPCSRARSGSKGSRSTARATSTSRSAAARPAARSCASPPEGGAGQAGVAVARMTPPCNPAGIAFGPDGRLYLSGFGAAGDEIGVVTPSAADPRTRRSRPGSRPARPGRTALAFDERRQPLRLGRRHGAGPRLPRRPDRRRGDRALPRADDGQHGRRRPPEPGVAARRARRRRSRSSPTGSRSTARACSTSPTPRAARSGASSSTGAATSTRRSAATRRYPPNTLCLDALFVQHPALDGADGIALDRKGDDLRRRERAERDRRRRPRRPRHGALPQPARRGQPAQRRPARVPDEPGARRPDALHDELGRRPPRQRAEHRGRGEPRHAVSARCRASTSASTRTGCRCRSTDVRRIEGRRGRPSIRAFARRNRRAYP